MRYLILLVVGSFIMSCSSLRSLDTSGFSIKENTVYYQDEAIAQLEGVEFALDNRKLVREMTFKMISNNHNDKINNLIAFLHEQHPDYEIELEVDMEMMGF
jgi:hypothetical protein